MPHNQLMTTPLIHVGIHKAASTWLQHVVFDSPDTDYVCPLVWKDVLYNFVLPNEQTFDEEATRDFVLDRFKPYESTDCVPVLSHERLCGSPFSGAYDRERIARRLKASFPAARVLIVIREQKSAIWSTYKQYLRGGGAAALDAFLSLPDHQKGSVPLYEYAFHDYDWLVRTYHKHFGEENVLTVPFELLLRDTAAFLRTIGDFTGANKPIPSDIEPTNCSNGATALALRKHLNLLFARSALNIAAPLYRPGFNLILDRLTDLIDEAAPGKLDTLIELRSRRLIQGAVGNLFRASNRRTSKLIDVNLADYGYDC